MKDKHFLNRWIKSIYSVEELKRRLSLKASKLEEGESSQFFVNGQARYLKKTNNKFIILKNKG